MCNQQGTCTVVLCILAHVNWFLYSSYSTEASTHMCFDYASTVVVTFVNLYTVYVNQNLLKQLWLGSCGQEAAQAVDRKPKTLLLVHVYNTQRMLVRCCSAHLLLGGVASEFISTVYPVTCSRCGQHNPLHDEQLEAGSTSNQTTPFYTFILRVHS